jgi:hypothetical protein
VTLRNADTGIVSTAITDSEGNYQFLNVRIGTCSVRAELQGFSAAIAENVALNKTNFGAPNGNRSSTDFGTIRSLSTTPRQIQLGVKLNF